MTRRHPLAELPWTEANGVRERFDPATELAMLREQVAAQERALSLLTDRLREERMQRADERRLRSVN